MVAPFHSTGRATARAGVLLALATSVQAHTSLIGVHGANGKEGTAFGVDIYGKFPRHNGQDGDAGADVSVFQTGVQNPQPPCGRVGYLGELDYWSAFSQAQARGIPTAHPNGSVVMTVFTVNRDGGGDMKCEYSHDASMTDGSWAPLTMDLNMEGKNGISAFDRFNSTVVTTFPKDATCSGGVNGNTCIIRCRAGFNARTGERYRFGGCAAVQLAARMGGGSTPPATKQTAVVTSGKNGHKAAPKPKKPKKPKKNTKSHKGH